MFVSPKKCLVFTVVPAFFNISVGISPGLSLSRKSTVFLALVQGGKLDNIQYISCIGLVVLPISETFIIFKKISRF